MNQRPFFAVRKRNLIALACASVFGMPQIASAQNAAPLGTDMKLDGHPLTLQGSLAVGIARIKSSGATAGLATDTNPRNSVWSGESNVRFSASSKLGGSVLLGFGFQVESALDMTTLASTSTLASRNTGIGLKTSGGSVWFGQWDTPYKTHISDLTVTQSSAGAMGSQTGFGASQGLGGGTGGLTNGGATATAEAMNFRRRQANTVNYYTPVFGGFRGALQWAPDETARPATGGTGRVPQLFSGRLDYAAGPFSLSAAYEHHADYLWSTFASGGFGVATAANVAGTRSSDKAFSLGGTYSFGDTKLMAFWEKLKWSQSGMGAGPALIDLDSSKWNVGFTSKISGPHGIAGAYGRVGSYGCNSVGGWAGVCTDTGAQHYELLYKYQLDRSSYLNVLYARMDNDRNGMWVPNGGAAGGAGSSYQSMSFGFQTAF